MAKKEDKKVSTVEVEVVGDNKLPDASPHMEHGQPALFLALAAAGLRPTLDPGANNFALISNQSPKVVGKDAQIIFDYDASGIVVSVRVL